MTWVKDNEDAYHNLDEYCQVSVVYDDDFKRYVIRAYGKTEGFIDVHTFNELEEAKLVLKNMMEKFT